MPELRVPEKVLSTIDALLSESDDKDKRELAADARRTLEELEGCHDCAECQYLIAYIGYLESSPPEEISSQLKRALALEPEHGRAWLYLGHVAYDNGRYAEATGHFENARAHMASTYLRIRAHEMIVCSESRRTDRFPRMDILASFIQDAEGSDLADVWPAQLAQIMGQYKPSPEDRAMTLDLARRLDRAAGVKNWFEGLVSHGSE